MSLGGTRAFTGTGFAANAVRLPLRDAPDVQTALRAPRRQRAIGVIYRPDTELQSHYLRTCLPQQFDAVVHIDTSCAVEPLDVRGPAAAPEAPETYPSGI